MLFYSIVIFALLLELRVDNLPIFFFNFYDTVDFASSNTVCLIKKIQVILLKYKTVRK